MTEFTNDGTPIGRRIKVVPDIGGEIMITSNLGKYILLEWSYVLDLERRLMLLEAEKSKEGETSSNVGEGD